MRLGMTVVLVEDLQADQMVPRPLLRQLGLDFVFGQTNTVQEALLTVRRTKPSIVIVDAKLSDGSNGREVIDALVEANVMGVTDNYGSPVVVAIDPQKPCPLTVRRGPDFETELRKTLEQAELLVASSPPKAKEEALARS